MGFQRSSERLNGVLLDALGEGIPEGGSDIYLKARWPYRFVLESLGLGTSRRDLDADLRRREGLCFWRRSERYIENAWVPLVLITAAALLLRESQILTVLSPLAVAKWSGLVGCQHNWSTLSPCPRKMCSLLCYILKKHALCEFMHLIHGFHQHLLTASDSDTELSKTKSTKTKTVT